MDYWGYIILHHYKSYICIIELFKIRLIGYWGDSSIGKWGDISIIMHHYTSFIQGIGGIHQLVTSIGDNPSSIGSQMIN